MRLGRVTNSGLTRHEERVIARRWMHRTRKWKMCYSHFGGFCLRCWWREVTKQNAKDKAAEVAWLRKQAPKSEPRVVRVTKRSGGGHE